MDNVFGWVIDILLLLNLQEDLIETVTPSNTGGRYSTERRNCTVPSVHRMYGPGKLNFLKR